jgi:hypothetical protein
MQKRYQVFVSSTFTDLKDERQAVLKAILELDHMPAGMELFPASDDSAWQLIKDVIDASDYYALIIGGRYGSLDEAGLGYTEKEYDYAVHAKKPVIAMLHQNPDNLPRDRTETDSAAWERLKSFRAKVESRHTCVYWTSVEELKSKVIVGLTAATKRHPAVGWVRANEVPSGATIAEVLTLRNRIAELESQSAVARTSAPEGAEDLKHGDDLHEISFGFDTRPQNSTDYSDWRKYTSRFEASWDSIFAAIAPTLINEASDSELHGAFRESFRAMATKALRERKDKLASAQLRDLTFPDHEVETCIVQFRALGLMQVSTKPRSVKDTNTYWQLTPYGDHKMTRLRAIRRDPPPAVPASGATDPDEVG